MSGYIAPPGPRLTHKVISEFRWRKKKEAKNAMIEIDEIRVGNWLCTHENSWGTVKSFGKTIMLQHALGTHGYFPEQLSPIEITLDILPLCGFQPYNAGYRHRDTHLFLRYYGIGHVAIEIANEIEACEFVHHLQNLYFDITGRLLEPNLYGN